MNRRGLGLAELIIALTLSAMIALLSWSILAVSAIRLRERSERMGLTHALRVSAAALRAVVEPLGSDSSAAPDLAGLATDRLTARVIRASGTVCSVAPESVVVRAGEDWWAGLRVPVGGRDTLLVGTLDNPPRWIAAALQSDPTGARCPDGRAGLMLSVPAAALGGAAVGPGSPLRVFEHVEIRSYGSGGLGWVGARLIATGEAIQPLAGPFARIAFGYFRRDGAPASTGAEAAIVVASFKGLTERAAGVGIARMSTARADSVELSILLRNVQ